MGLSGSKTKQTSSYTPSAQQLQAGDTLNTAFSSSFPKIQGYADDIGSLIPSLMDKYKAGNPATNAAQGWVTSVLGNTGGNPELEAMISRTNNSVGNGVNAKLGTRGLTGGSVQADMLSRALAENESGLRYNDYNNQNALKAQAAGMAPSLASSDLITIAPLLAAVQTAGGMPLDAASQYASGMGGLFSQSGTTTNTTKQSGGLLGGLLGAALSGWAGGGFG